MPDVALAGWFVGPSYTSRSLVVDLEECFNLYPEVTSEGGAHAKAQIALYGTPGRKLFTTLPAAPIRGVWAGESRLFVGAGPAIYEVYVDGTYQKVGNIDLASTPVQMYANLKSATSPSNQLYIVASNQGYICDGVTGGGDDVRPISDSQGDLIKAVTGAFIDGYFLAQFPDSADFGWSAVNDGNLWDALNFAAKSGDPYNIVSILADHEQIFLLGEQSIEVWENTGAPPPANPFSRIPMAFIEQGCAASFSAVKIDNTIMWLGKDSRGQGVVWRAAGYLPTRVSNHAVEYAIQSYSTISDAVAYAYQDGGHTFYVLSFPTADVTWVYDCATQMWHKRGLWNPSIGKYQRDIAGCHCLVFGQHIVGDWRNGNLYYQSINYLDDNGAAIRRLRRAPHLNDEAEWVHYDKMQLDMEVGTANSPLPSGKPPQVMMRFSDDGGRTWSNERWASAGSVGQYRTRVMWTRLGHSRDRVFEISVTDPINVAIIDGYLRTRAGLRPYGA